MMAAPMNAAGISKLTQQLRTASAATTRALAAVEQLHADIEEIQAQVESGFDDLQSELAELETECGQQGQQAVSAVRNLSETAEVGAEEHLPSASESLAQALTSSESSHEAVDQRLVSVTAELRQEGFEALASELAAALEEETEASSAMADGFSELESLRSAAQEVLDSAATEAIGRVEQAVSALEGETLTELDSSAAEQTAAVQSAAAAGDQEVEQIKGQVREAYGGWAGEVESVCDDLLHRVVASVEETTQHLLEYQQEDLHAPCEQLLVEAIPRAQGGLESVANEGSRWGGGCDDLSRTTGEMEQAKDAKDAFDRAVG